MGSQTCGKLVKIRYNKQRKYKIDPYNSLMIATTKQLILKFKEETLEDTRCRRYKKK